MSSLPAPDSAPAPGAANDGPGDAGSWLRAIRDALAGKQHDYTTGRLDRAIVLLAIPMVLEMAMESLFAVCDVFFVSKLGDAAVAAVGLTEAMVTIVYAFAVGFAMATTALVARRVGERDSEGAARAARQAIVLGLLFGAVTGLPCALFAGDLLALMSDDPGVVETGSGYTAVILGTNVVIVLLFLHNAVFRGAGDAALAMRALWLSNGINLVLDPCLIFGYGPFPELGVTGAGIATVIGRGTGVAYQLWALSRGKSRVALPRPLLRVEPAILGTLLRLSIGGVMQFLIATASWVALMRIVSPFGSSAVAGYTIAIRVLVFTILPSWGLSNAAATLVGQNLGARRPDRAERAVWVTGWYNAVFLGVVMVVFLLFGREVVALFSDKPDTIQHGADALRIMSYGYVFYAWGMVITQAFNGAGDTMTPTWINLACYWLFQVPLAWSLSKRTELGPAGVFWAVAIAESALALVSIAVFRLGRWKEVELARETQPAGAEPGAAVAPVAAAAQVEVVAPAAPLEVDSAGE
jgi:putative MATE family efflux protein